MKVQEVLIEEEDEPPDSRSTSTLLPSTQQEVHSFRKRYFPKATEEDWNEHHAQAAIERGAVHHGT